MKQQEVLQSNSSLIEIDLLRAGMPLVGGPLLAESLGRLEPRPDYLIGVSRAWQRGATLEYEMFSVELVESLPCIPVPLRENEPEIPLDLQYTFDQVYDSGPYHRGAVNYDQAPDPPIRPELIDWVAECLDRWQYKKES
jgi:hypothetical protein